MSHQNIAKMEKPAIRYRVAPSEIACRCENIFSANSIVNGTPEYFSDALE